jgi:predicted esterase YcpF (UPF0227 family)
MYTSLEQPHTPWGQQQHEAEQREIKENQEKTMEVKEEQEIKWLLLAAVHSHVPLEDYVAVSAFLALSLMWI